MADYKWPKRGEASVLGTSPDRFDGLTKSTGTAKYSYDITPEKTLFAKGLGCALAHCRLKKLDIGPAKKVPGVVAVYALKKAGENLGEEKITLGLEVDKIPDAPPNEIRWQGDLLAVVIAESDGAAAEGVAAIEVEYEPLEVFVLEEYLDAATRAGRTSDGGSNTKLENDPADELEQGDDEKDEDYEKRVAAAQAKQFDDLFANADNVIEGYYGIQCITHMCLEPHGSTCEWADDKLTAHLSTQNVSGTSGQFATPLGITADDVTVHCDYIGGGFGSKFSTDVWGVTAARAAKELGRPVKWMLDRDQELKNGGSRPSAFAKIRVGATNDGLVTVWDSHHWGTNGVGGGGVSQGAMPYVFDPPNRRRRVTNIAVNAAPARAWRAPNHPQACAVSQTAFDDVARSLGMDSYDVFLKNLEHVSNNKAGVYREQMKVAAELIDWKKKWHPHGKGERNGSIVSGLGMAIHTWGGGPHNSKCMVKIHPDGGVEANLGSQDIGTGTRTIIAQVVAESLGLPVAAVKVNLGSSKYPESGPSGGSTTVGGVAESSRRGAIDAFNELAAKVAAKLKVEADTLVAKEGRIHVAGDAKKGLSWKEACGLLGMKSIEVTGVFQPGMTKTDLTSSQVGGVQMAEVAVDMATGVVKMKKFVAVQDMGLVINPKTAISQINGAVIMGIAYALFEERIMDGRSGALLNAEIADYKLPRLGDIGEIVVHLYEPDDEYNRGVVGLGEPPVISPGAAISNAVCNALGVRVPVLPLTPQRVLDAMARAGVGV